MIHCGHSFENLKSRVRLEKDESMIEFDAQVVIDRTPRDVFRFVADLENLPNWNYFVLDVQKTPGTQTGVGTTYHQRRKTDQQELRIAAFEEGRLLTVETIPPSKPELVRRMEFHEEGGKTRLVDHWRLDTGHPAILQKLATRRVRSAVKENLGKLKELLETGRTTLQDGRTVVHP